MIKILQNSKSASESLQKIVPNKVNRVLGEISDQLLEQSERIIAANRLDLAKIPEDDPQYDLFCIKQEDIDRIAAEFCDVASQPTPTGRIIESTKRPNEMIISKVSAPYGVIGVIYEARPEFTFDSFALSFKSGNAVILKSTFEADYTNNAIIKLIRDVLDENAIDTNIVTLLPPDDEYTVKLLQADGYVDLAIPRGSQKLVNFVRKHATVPYIETGRGVNHIYIDKDADVEKAAAIVNNSKTYTPLAGNAVDCIIVHKKMIKDLPHICEPLSLSNVTIYADEESFDTVAKSYTNTKPSQEEHYNTEFMDYTISIKTVENINDAIAHIALHSAKNSEAIVTEDEKSAKLFTDRVDAACIYHNVSTAFTDGSEFGMGANIGISTQKFGARGPLGLRDLTTYKYVITGKFQIRE